VAPPLFVLYGVPINNPTKYRELVWLVMSNYSSSHCYVVHFVGQLVSAVALLTVAAGACNVPYCRATFGFLYFWVILLFSEKASSLLLFTLPLKQNIVQ
jgi:hypothetical protein